MNTDLPSPTYREIAKLTGFSIFSVSCALKDKPGVSAKNRLLIRQAAEKIGYQLDPLVTALMTRRRMRAPRRRLRTVIACLLSAETFRLIDRDSALRLFFRGLRNACEEAGFVLETLQWEDFGESPRRLFASLRARRVRGVVFFETVPGWCKCGWDKYAITAFGDPKRVGLHPYVSANYHNNAWLAMDRLAGLDYRRVGFAMTKNRGKENNYQAVSSYQGWTICAGVRNPPPLFWADAWERKPFLDWVRKSRLDAVVAAEYEPLEFLREAGFRLPEDIGFVHLDLDEDWTDLAGIRRNSYYIGEATAHHVIDQINRGVYGLSSHPRLIQITGEWFAGPTVREGA